MKTRHTHAQGRIRKIQAGLAATLLAAICLGGCIEEPAGIVTVCIAPTVTRTSPADGASNVSLNKGPALARASAVKVITATFSTPMDPATINASTFILRRGTDTISGTVSYSDTTAIFVVPNDLAPNVAYNALITTGARDRAGTPLALNHAWTFTTIAPGTPTLVSPADQSVQQPVNPTLVWNAVAGASTYRLQVSQSPGFAGTIYDDSTRTGTSQTLSGLAAGTTYYWRVNSKISGQTSAYSDVWRFTTVGPPAAPALVSPAAGAQNQSTSPTLAWLPSTGAATYRLQISTTVNFASLTLDDSSLVGTSRQVTGLAIGTTYYWRVNARNALGTSAYSTRNFTTIVDSLRPPVLAAPQDNSLNTSTNPTLSWNASTGAVTYRLQVSTSIAFITTVVDDSTLTGLSRPVNGLTVGTTYFWRVSAKNGTGTTAYSTIWRFTTSLTPAPSVNLGTAARFGGMGGSAGITNQGTLTQVNGDLITTAVSSAVTGFHDGTGAPSNVFTETPLNIGAVRDTIYTATAPPGSVPGAVAIQAQSDAQAAYLYLAALPPGSDPGAGELGGLTLAPGTYTAASGSFAITLVDLTLDAQGDPNAQFVFQIPSALTVGSAGPAGARSVVLINGAQPKNVFWQVGASATINGAGGGTMAGTIIASSGVTFSTAGNTVITKLEGRALSLVSSVTMVNTVINVPLP